METHFWRQSNFTIAGFVEGNNIRGFKEDRTLIMNPCLAPVQEYKCERCNEIISLPDCYHLSGKKNNFCLSLMLLGCKNDAKRPPLPPRKEKAPYESKSDYPAKKQKRGAK